MQGPSSPAPLAHTTLLWVVSAGRAPTASASPGRPGETRLALDATGPGYGATVVLVGPSEILATVVADLGTALEGVAS